MVPTGVTPYLRAKCACIALSAWSRKRRVKTDVARHRQPPLSRMVLLCAQQLLDHNVLNMIRAPPTRAEITERAPRLEQPGSLLIRQFCPHHTPWSAVLPPPFVSGKRTRLASIAPVFIGRDKVDFAQGGHKGHLPEDRLHPGTGRFKLDATLVAVWCAGNEGNLDLRGFEAVRGEVVEVGGLEVWAGVLQPIAFVRRQ
jgi:hypothetical protein